MKKKRITYGVFGMMEYQAIIKIGRATLKVLFTDGSITSLGQNPAQYTTSDFIVQHAIENSSDFKRGRIRVVNTIELDEEVRIERNHTASARQAAPTNASVGLYAKVDTASENAAPANEATGTLPEVSETGADEEHAAETATDDAETSTAATPGSTADGKAEGSASRTEVEFYTNQEAKDYLANTFGVKSAMRTRAEIIAAGETYGVKINFVNN